MSGAAAAKAFARVCSLMLNSDQRSVSKLRS
uniref:Uncharacterized protein n=1 Tax=Arundo donax TaxID=35708 RepID=A0A0A9AXB5_ARUDO